MATKTKDTDNKALATVENNAALPAHLMDKMSQHAGLGTSQAADDNIVPIISVLQPLSPQVANKNHEKFLPGAEAGDILVKNSEPPFIKGEDGIIFQPCYYFRKVVEWVPRNKGGGFVAHHDHMPEDVEERVDSEGKKKMVRKSNGNECIDTRYHVGNLVQDDGSLLPFVIPLSSSGHNVSRTWHTLMNALRLPNGEVPPSFARLYRLKTVQKTKNNNTWFTFDLSSAGWANEEQYDRGLSLYEGFAKGEKTVSTEVDESPASSDEKAPF